MSTAARYLPPLALMGVIFFLSAQPDLSTGLGFWDVVLRKLGHIAAFGLLTLLWWRALPGRRQPAGLLAAGISLLYAVSDEYHQTFVEGRSGSPVDVGVDAVGIALVLALIRNESLPFARFRPGQPFAGHSTTEEERCQRSRSSPSSSVR